MIYRFKSHFPHRKPGEDFWGLRKNKGWDFGRFGGCYFSAALGMSGLKSPTNIKNEKTRFYFTELGYKTFGPDIIKDAKENKVTLRVIRLKNPDKSQIVYEDEYQVAILPAKKNKK
jgi:hypothetical protein